MGELLDGAFRALKQCGLEAQNVIDVGAHLGGWTREAMNHWPLAQYLLLEPQADLIEESGFQAPNATWVCAGAGPSNGEFVFSHRQRNDSSTFRQVSRDDGQTRGMTVLPVVTLDTIVAERLGGVAPEIIKIDAEGWDLEVLRGASGCLGSTIAFFTEVGVSNPFFENTMTMMDAFMGSHGYRLFAISDIVINPVSFAHWNAELVWVLRGSEIDIRSLSRAGF